MSKKEKLISKLKLKSKDFTFAELETLLLFLGYRRSDKGRTSGSRVMFVNKSKQSILLHRPHGRKELLEYQMKQVIDILKKEGLI